MITTTKLNNVTIDNEENMLIRSDGTYNRDIHAKLSNIIKNIANKYIRTNETLNVEDLQQEAWLKIYEAIDRGRKQGKAREIQYLVMVAKNAILAECMNNASMRENIDDFSSMLVSSSDCKQSEGDTELNVAKANLEYEISKHRPNESDATILKISLEDTLSSLDDERVKNLIIIRYIKEFNGASEKIKQMYNDFYNSIDIDKQMILDSMDKFTYNAAFRSLGLRATDNCTPAIRARIKEVLLPLYQ